MWRGGETKKALWQENHRQNPPAYRQRGGGGETKKGELKENTRATTRETNNKTLPLRIGQYADAHGCETDPCTMRRINYYRNFLPDLSKRLRPINSIFLQKGVQFAFTLAMEKLVREILAEVATPPILVFSNWDAVADGSRPFHVYCDACIDGFGAALE